MTSIQSVNCNKDRNSNHFLWMQVCYERFFAISCFRQEVTGSAGDPERSSTIKVFAAAKLTILRFLSCLLPSHLGLSQLRHERRMQGERRRDKEAENWEETSVWWANGQMDADHMTHNCMLTGWKQILMESNIQMNVRSVWTAKEEVLT